MHTASPSASFEGNGLETLVYALIRAALEKRIYVLHEQESITP